MGQRLNAEKKKENCMVFMMFMVVFTEAKAHSSFYVFCKTVCKAIQPGKLRVRCRDCKQGTLTLSRVRICTHSKCYCDCSNT